MSKATVKKALKGMDQDSLVEMIMEMYSARREARDYLEFWVNPDLDKETESLKAKIKKGFFIGEDKPRRKPNFTELKLLLKNYFTLCHEIDHIIDIRLYYADIIYQWLKARNGIGMKLNKKRIYEALEEAETEIKNYGFDSIFEQRATLLRERVDDLYRNNTSFTLRRWRRWY